MTTTTNLEEFGFREIKMLRDLLDAWVKQGLPEDFAQQDVQPMMNTSSGFVFLTNSDGEVAMLNGDKLECFYSSPYEGKEGFYDELAGEYEDMCQEDQEWFRQIAHNLRKELVA